MDISSLLQNLREKIVNMLLVLSEKEKYIITKRFGLDNEERETLDKIGAHFKITRERVRQIENNAIKKLQRTAVNTDFKIITEYGKMLIKKYGGLVSETKLINNILNIFSKNQKISLSDIKLSIRLDKEITKVFNTINYQPHWKLNTISEKTVDEIASQCLSLLEKRGKVINLEELTEKIQKKLKHLPGISPELIISILEIDKKIKVVPEGAGLFKWRNINPRTLRDKILYILRKHAEPLHFVEITNKIINFHFDNKTINVQAVHNELIRNEEFVLIGRGIYALKEWGYQKGTISDIIKRLLNDGKPKSQEEIVKGVLRERRVKKISILLNLKNKPYFERIGRKIYRYVRV